MFVTLECGQSVQSALLAWNEYKTSRHTNKEGMETDHTTQANPPTLHDTLSDGPTNAPPKRHTVVIVGGGPHALAALSALHESSLALAQFSSDPYGASGLSIGVRKRLGIEKLTKIGSVCVVDPGMGFLEAWDRRFEALEITHLRSPALAHPRVYEPQALVHFAVSKGRTSELLNPPEFSKRLATSGGYGQEPLLFALPTRELFKDFCVSLSEELPHEWIQANAEEIFKDENTGKFRVRYASGIKDGWIVADSVILATGPATQLNIPAQFRPYVNSGHVTHTEKFLSGEKSVATLLARYPKKSRVLIIGGGLTAAQAAVAAVTTGSYVVLRSRRPLMTRSYDLHEDWLDQRHSNRLRYEFLATPTNERLRIIRSAIRGGSIPNRYLRKLQYLASTTDRLLLEVCEDLEDSVVRVEEERVHVDGEAFDHLILATGYSNAPAQSPLFQQVIKELELQTLNEFPILDESLSWKGDLYVLGASASLELGPGALNLMGAMRGARIVAEALRDLMWSSPKRQVLSSVVSSNSYSVLDQIDVCV